jgi:6-phosphogluconolactonase (cycloisomerase 2 family)
VLGVAALVALPAAAGASTAHDGHDGHDGFGFHAQHAVFVQTDNPAGNQVLVYDEAANGTLTPAGTYSTGGLGAQAAGSVVDHLASQGSLVYEAAQQLLVAVNAGSDTVSVFAVRGDRLFLREVLPSGGDFPDSIAVNDHVAYVLNAGGAGSVSGFRVFDGALVPLPGSTRSLGLANTSPPNYLSSPGQVAFSPDGSQLLVTTKASTNAIDVFGVSWNGWLSAAPVVNASSAPVPFALVFAPNGQAVVAQAGNSSVGTYALAGNGTLTNLSTLPDGQTALCWITGADGFYYVANAGSATLSAYTVSPSGVASLVGTTGVVATTDAGPIDMAASADGSTLYVEAGGAGAVDEFHVNADGSLTSIGSVTGLGAGIEGIAAS